MVMVDNDIRTNECLLILDSHRRLGSNELSLISYKYFKAKSLVECIHCVYVIDIGHILKTIYSSYNNMIFSLKKISYDFRIELEILTSSRYTK